KVHLLWEPFHVTDTPPEVAELVRLKLMSRSNAERFIIRAQMFDAARRMVLASLPAGLRPEELKRQFFERLYGAPAVFQLAGNPSSVRSETSGFWMAESS